MTTEELRTKVFACVDKAIAEGNTMKRWQEKQIKQDNECCVLEAISFPRETFVCYDKAAQERLECSPEQACSLEGGFEGWHPPTHNDPEFYAIGQEVAEKYL